MKLKSISIALSTTIIAFSMSNSVSAKNNYNISRLYGENLYEASINIPNQFGKDKIDNIITQKRYLDSMNYSNLILLGGKSAVSEAVEDILKVNDKALFITTNAYEHHNKKYIKGHFVKWVTDLNEARDYEKRTGNIIIWNDHDGIGDYIPDDGFDMPISSTATLEVDDNVKITKIDFNASGNILHIDKNFNDIINGSYKSTPVFNITLNNGKVTEMYQEYRP